MYLTAMFGRFKFEKTSNDDVGGRFLARETIHPWYEQLCNDIQLIRTIDNANCIVDGINSTPERLIHDEDLRTAFLELDFAQIKIKTYTVSVPHLVLSDHCR